MSIETKQNHPISFGTKVAVAVLVASVILGGLLRLSNDGLSKTNKEETRKQINTNIFNNMLIPIIPLPLKINAPEKDWTDALTIKINGQSEVRVDRGRVDVMTDAYAIEIDFLKKWHEGLGQAIHYGSESTRIGVLALIIENDLYKDPDQAMLLKKIESLCVSSEIKLILLVPANKSG